MSVAWKLRRLSAMEPGEIAWRTRQALQAVLERAGLFAATAPPPAEASFGVAWLAAQPEGVERQKYQAAADRILNGEFRVFALSACQLGFPPRWNRDPKTGREAPLKFGKSLDYRDEAVVGDIKYLWEPSRHAELVTLAQAWRLTRDDRYSMGCRTLLDSWWEQCPYPLGPHWTSSLEHGVRLMNWAMAWQLLGGAASPLFASADGQAFRARWLASIYQHCHFIAGHFSRHSSANNHLLGELAGLLIAALTWRCWPESIAWRDSARSQFEEQALEQNGGDGVNREQAVWYHHEVADMMLIAGLAARANGFDFSSAYWRRLESMLEFLVSIMDVGGHVPAFGDADDAVIARLDPDGRFDAYQSLLATGAVLFERSDFAVKAARLDDKSRWLLGDAAAARFGAIAASGSADAPPRRTFAQAGYYILGNRLGARDEVRIVFDAGPLGYRSIAAHGHADALSFTLSMAGNEFLIDPGTFAYHTQKAWRDYFRGGSAHNTVRVDARDQSQSGGNFLWLSHARSRVLELESSADSEWIVAEHDGYRRLRDPVLHRRTLRLDRRTSVITVIDELVCTGEHDVELFWHFSERCDVRLDGTEAWVRQGDCEMRMAMPAQMRTALFRGSQNPLLGWRSLKFDERLPSPTLRAAVRIGGSAQLTTTIVMLNLSRSQSDDPVETPVADTERTSARWTSVTPR